ncbi:hypothetical protein BD779DRAFT_1631383 [Infundibulicybe gibba]|nr:hypothetical protein BD779DRAFT_1631383 [Infundibulicybe gibba]
MEVLLEQGCLGSSAAQHYCVECAKYYETDSALQSHWRSKVHKRRSKQLKGLAHTIEEAERAAGLGREGRQPMTTAAGTPTYRCYNIFTVPYYCCIL